MPCPRMNVHAAAGEDGLWIVGGKCDGGDREATFDDVWWMQWCEGRQGLRSVLVQGMSAEADVWFDSDDDEEDAEGDGEAGEEEGQEGKERRGQREAGLERGGAEGVGERVKGGVTAEEEVQEREEEGRGARERQVRWREKMCGGHRRGGMRRCARQRLVGGWCQR